MPLLNLYTSADVPSEPAKIDGLLKDLSSRMARHLNKPESYVMTCLLPRTRMTFGGTTAPACFVEIKNIGALSPELTEKMSRDVCTVLEAALAVPADRIYIEFTNADGALWGWDGSTFG